MKRIIVRNSKRCNPILTKGDMFLVKLRKLAARLYELKRVLCQESAKDHVKKSTVFVEF